LALNAGPEGFDVYDRLIPAAVNHLVPGGWLLLEIGFAQEEGVRQRMTKAGFDLSPTVRDDQRHPRVVAGRKKRSVDYYRVQCRSKLNKGTSRKQPWSSSPLGRSSA